jgi:hypothetical protein
VPEFAEVPKCGIAKIAKIQQGEIRGGDEFVILAILAIRQFWQLHTSEECLQRFASTP